MTLGNNEHKFILNNEEYLLTWYDKPKVLKNGVEQKIPPILKAYITYENLPIPLINSNGNQEVPYTLARKILTYFSNDKLQIKETNKRNKQRLTKVILESKECTHHFQKLFDKTSLSSSFKIVMMCSIHKNESFFTNFKEVTFKAISNGQSHFHPDDFMFDDLKTWRTFLQENQLDPNLKRSFELYKRHEYRTLHERYGESFYILSAGWGLIHSEYRLPKYDITFSNYSDNTAKRKPFHEFKDFNQLKSDQSEDIVFIGGRDYLPLFYQLTKHLKNRKIVYYFGDLNNLPKPKHNISSFNFRLFSSKNNRKWHYELAQLFSKGIIP